jgi:hypothetical protein
MIRSALAAALALTVATWTALVGRIVSDPTNHVAVEPLLAVVPFVILASLAWSDKVQTGKALRVGLLVYALLSILVIVGADRANVLVQYDRWAKRGMPNRPCAGIAGHIWSCKP